MTSSTPFSTITCYEDLSGIDYIRAFHYYHSHAMIFIFIVLFLFISVCSALTLSILLFLEHHNLSIFFVPF